MVLLMLAGQLVVWGFTDGVGRTVTLLAMLGLQVAGAGAGRPWVGVGLALAVAIVSAVVASVRRAVVVGEVVACECAGCGRPVTVVAVCGGER